MSTTYLQITMKISEKNRPSAAAVYERFKQPFLTKIAGARAKDLLLRGDDVQVLHKFDRLAQAEAYLQTSMFQEDIVEALKPILDAAPDIRIYQQVA